MTIIVNNGLSAPQRTVIMRAAVASVAFLLLCLFAETAAAQEQPQGKRDDLDVTMQIIVDPDAKLPDEVVRRIPLPTRKAAESPPPGTTGKPESADGGRDKEQDRGNEAREQGRETSEAAKERAREAAEQREAARRAEAEERRRERGPPDDRPNPPNRPPRN
jgi:type IV secretory pathway VirB10-like protein